MKGIRVRVLKRFKSLQQFHPSKDHITIYDQTQNPPTYKQHEHKTREEEFDLRLKSSRKGHIEANNKLQVKDVIGYGHYAAVRDNEYIFQECGEEAFHNEHFQMEDIFQECSEEAFHNEHFQMEDIFQECSEEAFHNEHFQMEGSNSVILYTTSLRGIKKTFEDCQSIKFLLDSFQVEYDERDVSMHLEFREELWKILGGRIIPPRLFIKGKLVGGADEVVTLHECGKLKGLLEGIALVSRKNKCKGCGNIRFVLCCSCHGSTKVFNGEGKDGSFSRCLKCNENGLIKCPVCDDLHKTAKDEGRTTSVATCH